MQPTQSQTPVTGESPKRIQRKRVKGWKMPEGAVYVGRPSRWGNPFRAVKRDRRGWQVIDDNEVLYQLALDKREALVETVRLYAMDIDYNLTERPPLSELRGKDLACWCPLLDENGKRFPCHADVLLSLANPAGGE